MDSRVAVIVVRVERELVGGHGVSGCGVDDVGRGCLLAKRGREVDLGGFERGGERVDAA